MTKRPAVSDTDDDEGDARGARTARTAAASSHQNRVATSRNPVSNAFQREVTLRKNKEYQALNTAFAAAVLDYEIPPPTDDDDRPADVMLNAQNEYLRMAATFERMYGGVPCEVLSTGSNEAQQLGIENQSELLDQANVPPMLIPRLRSNIRMVKAGGLHSLALSTAGIPYSWGSSDDGTLGRPATDDVQEYTPLPITGFVRNDGVKEDGQILQIAAGDTHNLFLSLSGTVYQCGMYKDGDSGKFSDINGVAGTPVGCNANPVHVFQMPGKVLGIYAKGCVNAALLEDFTVATWGFGICGELARSSGMTIADDEGRYDVGKQFIYRNVTKFDDKNKETYVDREPDLEIVKEHYLKPKVVHWSTHPQLKRTVIAVALGYYHILVAARDPGQFQAKLYSSGHNKYGQLGHGDAGDSQRHTLTLVKALEHENIAQMAAGEHFSLALSHDRNRLFSFGRADYGQLGIGIVPTAGDFRATPQPVKFPKPIHIAEIDAGDRHAMAISDKHELYTWGFNEQGATGHRLVNKEDVYRPRLLNLMDHVKDATTAACHVCGVSGGGQHSLILVEQFRARAGA